MERSNSHPRGNGDTTEADMAKSWMELTTQVRGQREIARTKGTTEAWENYLTQTAEQRAEIERLEREASSAITKRNITEN